MLLCAFGSDARVRQLAIAFAIILDRQHEDAAAKCWSPRELFATRVNA